MFSLLLVCALQAPKALPSRTIDGFTFTQSAVMVDKLTFQKITVTDPKKRVIFTAKDFKAYIRWVADVDKDGTKEVAITTFTGGAHAYENEFLLSLGKVPTILGKFEMGNISGFELKDLNGDGKSEIVGGYDGLAYYHAPYVDSAHVPMVMGVEGGKLVDKTTQFPGYIQPMLTRSMTALAEAIREQEDLLVKQETRNANLFDTRGGRAVEPLALAMLLGKEKEVMEKLQWTLSLYDYDKLEKLRPEIKKIIDKRTSRLTYPKIGHVYDVTKTE